ncbi:MAG: thiamine pyrophosphate-binding protein [Oscillospiraceae bacterium]|nr:thiamine pyrophosphate-binding protein [Oscillospiraceae bacterium]
MRVSEYIADFLAKNGIEHVFSVVGGGAMYLNSAFAEHEKLRCIYNHHEQACAMAAESYARVNNKIAAVCVTSGPGGTNALTGVLGGFLDSVPMLIISGQVKYDHTARCTQLPLRAMGDQEFDIISTAKSMTKYAAMITDPDQVPYCLEKALYLAQEGRKGPCWLDIPLDIQGAKINIAETATCCSPIEEKKQETGFSGKRILSLSQLNIARIHEKIKAARRPVFYAGNGIRLGGVYEDFLRTVDTLGIPVVTCWNSIDLLWDDHPLYAGRGGIMGDRAGNFAVENSDLLLAVGTRLSIRQVGYNHKNWARGAYKIMVDIDPAELIKPTLNINLPIHAHCGEFMRLLLKNNRQAPLFKNEGWLEQCHRWREKYPVVLPKHHEETGRANVYCFIAELSARAAENSHVVVGNGSACVVGSHAWRMKKNQRFYVNSGAASMGYCLPGAIGVSFSTMGKQVILVTGDGSIQMNLQELQTIVHHKLPIKIFVINNGGYHSIRQTQDNVFPKYEKHGIGEDSGDLSFPSMEKLVDAYGIPYFSISTNSEMPVIDSVLACEGYCLCEVFVTQEQVFEPKAKGKILGDGTLYTPPLEDLAPFLPREELAENMYIPTAHGT